MEKQKITKAVILVAGLGTRSLPATKSVSKVMLPVFNKPVAHYIVEDLVSAGIKDIIWVVSSGCNDLQKYFDMNYELEEKLKQKNKIEILQEIRKIHKMANMIYVYQHEALGTGHAVAQAAQVVGNEPFMILNGDDVFVAETSVAEQMIDVFNEYQKPMMATLQVDNPEKYGVVDGKKIKDKIYNVKKLVEKPKKENTPSNLANVGYYIFTASAWKHIKDLQPSAEHGNEYLITDVVEKLAQEDEFYAYEFDGTRYDCGDWLGYAKAFTKFALEDKNIGEDLKKWINKNYESTN
ncbi:MAG: UTP--glucose-1-phosphate uridylyltransferase [Patescibacteria group bacterium]